MLHSAPTRPSDSGADGPALGFWPLHLAGWFALGLSMWVGVLAHVEEPVRAFAHKMIFAALGAVLTLGLRPLYRRLLQGGRSIPTLVLIAAFCSYMLSLVWSASYTLGMRAFDAVTSEAAFAVPAARWLVDGALFYTFIPMAWSVLYVAVKYYHDLHATRERALAAEGHAHRARLQALRYQLNPHFLFNTLNAVSTLISERRNRDAERMIARLSDFLRLTIHSEATATVPLVEEIDFARRYLDIERIRFGERLRVHYEIESEALSALVPPLLLQPLVENAVHHGIMPREEGGTLTLEASLGGGRLLLRIADDGPGPPESGMPNGRSRKGVGLPNVKARLEAHYDENFAFTVQRSDGGGCAVHLDLPVRVGSVEDAVGTVPLPRDMEAYSDMHVKHPTTN